MSYRARLHFFLIAISAGLFATSVSGFGADPGTGYSTAIGVPSHAARRAVPAHPIDLPIPTRTPRCSAPGSSTNSTRRLCARLGAFW